MSALPPKADIVERDPHVCFVPAADIRSATQKLYRLLENPSSRSAYSRVVKTNPALRFCERLGFRITHEDERKFYMRHDCRVP
jgi:hypothetical protein